MLAQNIDELVVQSSYTLCPLGVSLFISMFKIICFYFHLWFFFYNLILLDPLEFPFSILISHPPSWLVMWFLWPITIQMPFPKNLKPCHFKWTQWPQLPIVTLGSDRGMSWWLHTSAAYQILNLKQASLDQTMTWGPNFNPKVIANATSFPLHSRSYNQASWKERWLHPSLQLMIFQSWTKRHMIDDSCKICELWKVTITIKDIVWYITHHHNHKEHLMTNNPALHIKCLMLGCHLYRISSTELMFRYVEHNWLRVSIWLMNKTFPPHQEICRHSQRCKRTKLTPPSPQPRHSIAGVCQALSVVRPNESKKLAILLQFVTSNSVTTLTHYLKFIWGCYCVKYVITPDLPPTIPPAWTFSSNKNP